MWRIIKGFEISSCHMIKGHPKCGKKHGHNWQLTARFKFNEDVFIGFAELKNLVAQAISKYDHTDLGDMPCERLARLIRNKVRSEFVHCYPVVVLEDLEIELYETNKYGVIC